MDGYTLRGARGTRSRALGLEALEDRFLLAAVQPAALSLPFLSSLTAMVDQALAPGSVVAPSTLRELAAVLATDAANSGADRSTQAVPETAATGTNAGDDAEYSPAPVLSSTLTASAMARVPTGVITVPVPSVQSPAPLAAKADVAGHAYNLQQLRTEVIERLRAELSEHPDYHLRELLEGTTLAAASTATGGGGVREGLPPLAGSGAVDPAAQGMPLRPGPVPGPSPTSEAPPLTQAREVISEGLSAGPAVTLGARTDVPEPSAETAGNKERAPGLIDTSDLAPVLGAPFAGLVRLDLAEMERNVDAFFSRLGRLGGEWAGPGLTAKMAAWLTVAAAVGCEFTRRRLRRPPNSSHQSGETVNLVLIPTEDEP
jgi:hypothetical protein